MLFKHQLCFYSTSLCRHRMLSVVVMLFCACSLSAQSINDKITFELNHQPLGQGLQKVGSLSGFHVSYAIPIVAKYKDVSVPRGSRTVKHTLNLLLSNTDLKYVVVKKNIVITQQNQVRKVNGDNRRGHSNSISGVINDADGMPLIGTAVRIEGSKLGTITDADGSFQLQPGEDNVTLLITYIGKKDIRMRAKRGSLVKIVMEDNVNTLQDVVVTGYQTLKKYNVTGAVNTIDNKKIDLRSTNTLQGVLEGAVPGLTVYNNEYRIRGGASLKSGNKPLFIVDDFEVEELPENMDLVESVTVLKDAAATAIWGSRAANGVVVISTKKGKAQQLRISYSGNVKISSAPDFDDLHRVNSEQLLDYDRAAFLGGYYFPGYFGYSTNGYSLSQEIINKYIPASGDMNDLTSEQLANLDKEFSVLGKNYNRKQIEKYLLRNALQQHHMLSFSGGNDKVNYFLSGSFVGGHSSYEGDNNQSININSRTSYKVLPFLTLRSDINATFVKNDNGYSSLSSDVYNLYPYQMLVDDQGGRVADYSSFNHDFSKTMVSTYGYYDQGKNLLDEVDLANDKTKGTIYKIRVGADFKILDGLNLSADYQYEKTEYTNKNIISKNSYEGRSLINWMAAPDNNNKLKYSIPNGDILDHQQANTDAWIFKLGTTLNKNFGSRKEHYVNAVAGFELRSRHYYAENYRKLGYDDQLLSWQPIDAVALQDGINWWNGDTNRYYSTSYDSFSDVLNKELSYFLSGTYTYDNRYTLSASFRIDKSNLFGVSDKYRRNPIWAIGANWNIKNEEFFKSDAITSLILRASYGLTGNFDRTGSTTPVMVGRRMYLPAVGDYVVRLSTPPNPKLRWERNRSVNVSLDLGLFDRINTTLTYYNNYCYDLLGSTLIDPTTGYERATINAADMRNRGLEVQVNADVVKMRNFVWNINWIFSYNTNKILNNRIYESSPQLDRVTGGTAFVEGYARESIWSYRWAGLDEKGEPMVYNKAGEKTYDIATLTGDDLVNSGTYQPKYNGSLSTGFRYKNLQMNFLFTYNFGHVFRSEYPSMDAYASSPSLTDKIAQRWRKAGDENTTDIACLPKMEDNWAHTNYRSYAVQYSSNSIRKGDMIRLREILVNYELPQTLLRKTPIRRLSLTAQLNNVWLWTSNKEGFDPEAVSPLSGRMSFSQPLSFTAGVKIDF